MPSLVCETWLNSQCGPFQLLLYIFCLYMHILSVYTYFVCINIFCLYIHIFSVFTFSGQWHLPCCSRSVFLVPRQQILQGHNCKSSICVSLVSYVSAYHLLVMSPSITCKSSIRVSLVSHVPVYHMSIMCRCITCKSCAHVSLVSHVSVYHL